MSQLKNGKNLTIILSVLTALILLIEIVFWIIAQNNFWEYIYAFTYFLLFFIAVLAGIWGGYLVGLHNTFGRALYALGCANIFILASITTIDYYINVSNSQMPYPSISNVFYLLFIPTTAIGLGFLLKLYNVHINNHKILTKIVSIILVSIFIIFYFIGFPSIRDASALADTFDLLYALGDVILLALVLIIISVSKKRMYHGLYIYLAGITLHIFGDVLFVTRVKEGLYFGIGDPAEIAYILSALCLALGIVTLKGTFERRLNN